MPVYEYMCRGCGVITEELRSIAKRDARHACARCETPMRRIVSAVLGVVRDPAVPKKINNK